jgi:hypothetical protein
MKHECAYPQDRELIVYFEWDADPLTGQWKGPDGRVVSISQDARIQTNKRISLLMWMSVAAPERSGVNSGPPVPTRVNVDRGSCHRPRTCGEKQASGGQARSMANCSTPCWIIPAGAGDTTGS